MQTTTLHNLLLIVLIVLGSVTLNAQTKYFPDGVFEGKAKPNSLVDELTDNWYSGQLKAMEEPSLYEESSIASLESYRFLWLRTFHHPIAIRVDIHTDGSAQITIKMNTGAGGFNPGKVKLNQVRTLSQDEVKRFLELLEKDSFWSLQSEDRSKQGLDGSQWIVEGIKAGKYHLVDRWSPNSGYVYELGKYFIDALAHLNIPKEEFY